MIPAWVPRTIIASALAVSFTHATAQTGTNSSPTAQPPTTPVTTEIKRSVVFLQTDCLHDFGPDITQLTPDVLSKLTPEQVLGIKQQLMVSIMRLQKLKVSMAKLSSAGDIALLKPETLPGLELLPMLNLVVKMASLTDADLRRLTVEEKATLPTDTHMGTGFIVVVPDARIPIPANSGKDFGFGYLVTNRHVVQPGIEDGKPCHVVNYLALINRIADSTHKSPYVESVGLANDWHFSTDDSVDLAVIAFSPSTELYDYQRIPVDLFITQEMIDKKQVVEGDPALFSGLFIQSFQEVHSLEPIVRSGTLAMVPNESLETSLHKPGRVYLVDAHAFNGNSGSPVFVDIAKFNNPFGYSYRLLGVVSGEVLESSDFVMRVTTSFKAKVAANSDVSMVVPATEIRSILYDPALQAGRDAAFAHSKQ